jgi:hypothetical protein
MLDHPVAERRSWLSAIAPAYLGVFIWVPFLDALGRAGAGAPGATLGALVAVITGAGLLYLNPARLGWFRRERLPVVASQALGVGGAEWIVGVLYGFFGLVWSALAIFYSVKLTLLGLVALDLIGAAEVGPWRVGGLTLESPLFLVAAAFWTFIIASANGLRLVGVIAALMKVYAPVACLLLILLAAWTLFHPAAASVETAVEPAWGPSSPRAVQLVFGYFAYAALMGVEWGAASRERRDVEVGQWLGIVAGGGPAVVAAILLGASDTGVSGSNALDWQMPSGSFQGAVFRGFGATAGPRAAGTTLLLFGLAALAPACYGAAIFTSRFRAHWPALRRWRGVGIFYAVVLTMAATGLAARTETIFAISGALFAPAAGILTAAAYRPRAGAVAGWLPAGVAAWAIGVAVGLAPVLGAAAGVGWLESIQPASPLAYLTALFVYGFSTPRPPAAPSTATPGPGRPGDDG